MQPYFAAEPLYSPRMAARLMERVDRWYERLSSLRAYQRARRIRQAYYGLPSDASPFDVTSVASLGDQGELSALNINQLGVLGQRILSMTVQDDMGWQPVAANMDADSQGDTAIARSVLDYERRTGLLDRTFALAAETSFLDASAWLAVRWDVRGGTKYDELTEANGQKRAVYTGKLRVTLHPWWRTMVDLYRHDAEHEWCVLVDFHNKYDLAARFAPLPSQEGLRNRLLNLAYEHPRVMQSQIERGSSLLNDETPLVPVYCLYHRPTEAVPQGRETWVVDGGTVLYDGAAVYGQELPAVRIAPGEWLDTPHGHTPLSNLVAPQQALNMVVSSVVTNVADGAVAKLWVPPQSNLKVATIDSGAEVWESELEPKAIITTGNNSEAHQLTDRLQDFMVSLAHLNQAALGNAERAMPGNLAALFDAKAREAMAPFIRSYRWAVEQVGTRIVDCYKRFAKVPRTLEVIAGEDRRYLLEGFTGEQLGDISRVTVEARNSLLDTTSGKIAFVENLMAMPTFAANPRALGIVYQIYNTGRIDPLLLDPETEDILIQRENEMLLRGEEPAAMFDDPHEDHLSKHRRVAANPEARFDPAKMAAYEAHQAQHRTFLAMQAQGAMGPGMPPAPGVAPQADPMLPAPPPGNLEPMDAGPNSPDLPQLPVNPATGERALEPAA